ncbi:MAG: hypothetical protein QMA99_10720 [Flavobacterium sp.]
MKHSYSLYAGTSGCAPIKGMKSDGYYFCYVLKSDCRNVTSI